MTKKDFEMLAGVIRPQVTTAQVVRGMEDDLGRDAKVSRVMANTVEAIAYNLVQGLADDNPRFDHVRFYKACGFEIVNNHPRVFPLDD